MTTVPPVEEVAPELTTRVRSGDLATPQMVCIGLGVVLVLVSLLSYVLGEETGGETWRHFLHSYLIAYCFGLGTALCALFFVMLQHVTRAGWSVSIRRVAENLASSIWIFIPLFIPILIGFDTLYPWVHADPADEILAGKSGYLNKTFFLVRVAIYFAIWIGLAAWFKKKSLQQDESGDPKYTMQMARVGAPGILLFAMTITFASFDWIMSLDPHWFSTIFGICFFAGSTVAVLAYLILFCMWLGRCGYLKNAITTEHYHDLGKLLFSFAMFWTYTNFSQYMLIWYANLPEETAFYQHRLHDGWGFVGVALIVGHFAVPFVFLMSRHVKRTGATLAIGSAFLLFMHWVDLQYLIMPNMSGHGGAHATDGAAAAGTGGAAVPHAADQAEHHATWLTHLNLFDLTTLLGVMLLMTGVTIRNLRAHPIVPVRDPRLNEALRFENF